MSKGRRSQSPWPYTFLHHSSLDARPSLPFPRCKLESDPDHILADPDSPAAAAVRQHVAATRGDSAPAATALTAAAVSPDAAPPTASSPSPPPATAAALPGGGRVAAAAASGRRSPLQSPVRSGAVPRLPGHVHQGEEGYAGAALGPGAAGAAPARGAKRKRAGGGGEDPAGRARAGPGREGREAEQQHVPQPTVPRLLGVARSSGPPLHQYQHQWPSKGPVLGGGGGAILRPEPHRGPVALPPPAPLAPWDSHEGLAGAGAAQGGVEHPRGRHQPPPPPPEAGLDGAVQEGFGGGGGGGGDMLPEPLPLVLPLELSFRGMLEQQQHPQHLQPHYPPMVSSTLAAMRNAFGRPPLPAPAAAGGAAWRPEQPGVGQPSATGSAVHAAAPQSMQLEKRAAAEEGPGGGRDAGGTLTGALAQTMQLLSPPVRPDAVLHPGEGAERPAGPVQWGHLGGPGLLDPGMLPEGRSTPTLGRRPDKEGAVEGGGPAGGAGPPGAPGVAPCALGGELTPGGQLASARDGAQAGGGGTPPPSPAMSPFQPPPAPVPSPGGSASGPHAFLPYSPTTAGPLGPPLPPGLAVPGSPGGGFRRSAQPARSSLRSPGGAAGGGGGLPAVQLGPGAPPRSPGAAPDATAPPDLPLFTPPPLPAAPSPNSRARHAHFGPAPAWAPGGLSQLPSGGPRPVPGLGVPPGDTPQELLLRQRPRHPSPRGGGLATPPDSPLAAASYQGYPASSAVGGGGVGAAVGSGGGGASDLAAAGRQDSVNDGGGLPLPLSVAQQQVGRGGQGTWLPVDLFGLIGCVRGQVLCAR